ncbi:MAG: hypothetical protein CL946_05470 [Ectothiorhodospiraceae bacterium]|nr:hypothetical protein [Ectothiorhodospiraceae bacterium]
MDARNTLEHVHDILESKTSGVSRRTFMKAAGFTVAAVAIGCERPPSKHAIPHNQLAPEATPGKATWYASTCYGCSAGCGVLVKNRDGRPIKIEGNPDHPVSKGGLCAIGQASVLDVYDSHRMTAPMINGAKSDWASVDGDLRNTFANAGDRSIWIVTGTINSPTERAAIERFKNTYPNTRHVEFDPLSSSAMLAAHEEAFGGRLLPRIDFAKAEVIASFDADFLGTWYSPVEHTQLYQLGRAASIEEGRMSRHVQYESRMSLTGSNADIRYPVDPEELRMSLDYVHQAVRAKAGLSSSEREVPKRLRSGLKALVQELWDSCGRSIVLCGTNDPSMQQVTIEINHLLGNYGKTLTLDAGSIQRRGDDNALSELIAEVKLKAAHSVLLYGVNPVYDLPKGSGVREALASISNVISFSPSSDETSEFAQYICPTPHALEQWNDLEPVEGVYCICQPTVQALRETRPFAESLWRWAGDEEKMYDIVRSVWKTRIQSECAPADSFEMFWRSSVQQGFAQRSGSAETSRAYHGVGNPRVSGMQSDSSGFFAVPYPKVAMLDGRHASNPWLQELPDPITKIVWDNYLCLSPEDAKELGLEEGDVASLSKDSISLELPVHIQIGQAVGTVAAAIGYGRMGTDRFKDIGPSWIEDAPTTGANGLVGVRVNDMFFHRDGCYETASGGWAVTPLGQHVDLAASQKFDFSEEPDLPGYTGEKRDCLQKTTLAAFLAHGKDMHTKHHEYQSMWSGYDYNGHHWGMAIDLTACTGCSSCVISCQAENNIPVVGKDEVRRHRSLQWIRIDRYYDRSSEGSTASHQPMMCHQCDNAPCETVCPVLATAHSEEGLNQQVYNRCVGTRYCANNCPYKVRRFNWFDYKRDDKIANLVLNPDVTVRERGVMEKCSFCIQRIQDVKIRAKAEGRQIADSEIQPACAQSCPANAIVFGDMNDPNSEISKSMKNQRHYYALEEVGTLPSLGYLKDIKNPRREEA